MERWWRSTVRLLVLHSTLQAMLEAHSCVSSTYTRLQNGQKKNCFTTEFFFPFTKKHLVYKVAMQLEFITIIIKSMFKMIIT